MHLTEHFGRCVARLPIFLIAIAVGACTTIEANRDALLIEQIQKATTTADHSSLAGQYEQEAKTARQKAAEHRIMQDAYRGRAGVGRGGAEVQSSILRHCANLVSQYERAAVEYDGLVSLHRLLADEVKR